MDDLGAAKIDMQCGDKSLDIFEAELDAEALETIEPG
jgi:hypothetical protein